MAGRISRRDFVRYSTLTGVGVFAATAGAPKASAAVFDARHYGVIADGSPHNNVANLLDCVTEAAAVGASVLLPAGVIDTSEAVAGAIVTADSGRRYENNGGIPLPVSTPMTISGQGQGVTIIRLSAGFPRAFDFWWVADGQRYSNITIRRMTIDRNNLTGLAIAPPSAVSGGVTLTRDAWTTLPGISANVFKNVRLAWFPETNGGTAKNVGMASRVSEGVFQVRNDSDSTDYIVLPGDRVQGSLKDHVIVGTKQFGGSVPSGWDMTVDRLVVDDVESINVSTQTAASLTAGKSDNNQNIMVDLQKHSGTVVPTVTNSVIRNVRMNGGEGGAFIGGQAGCFIDECWFIDSFHDTMVDPLTNYVSANFMFGQNAWVGRVGVIRCHGRRSGDVACEIDQPWEAYETDCVWDDAFNGVFTTSFVPPARTRAGPSTTILGTDIGATWNGVDALVVTIAGLPSGTSRSGVLQIDGELFWYTAMDEAATSLSVSRGLNGTTTAPHTAGTAVTFVETPQTRFHSIRSTIRNSAVMSVAGAGRCFLQYENDNLPLPPVSIQDASIHITGGSFLQGQGVYWIGWQPDLSVDGLRFSQAGLYGSSAADGSAISWSWPYGTAHGPTFPFPAPRIRGHGNHAQVRGIAEASSAVYSVLQPGDGYSLIDFDITADVILRPRDSLGPSAPAG